VLRLAFGVDLVDGVDGVEREERKGDAAKRCGWLAIEDEEDAYDGWVFGVV
jgi:hypothetical protein